MRAIESVPPTALRRAAAIARGPHACPSCECPTFAEPPVPWVGLRDFFVRCDSCDRPLHVRVERDHVLRLESAPRAISRAPGMYDPVTELLDGGGRRAFVDRVAAAAWLPLLVALLVLGTGGTDHAMLGWWLAVAAILPAAVWGPATVAALRGSIRTRHEHALTRVRRGRERTPLIAVEPGRWDQWMREEKRRTRERIEHPEAVLRELERVLDDRELRRVRALAERGEVPVAHLEDLLRYRRSWTATVA